jgi:hypothetical protein
MEQPVQNVWRESFLTTITYFARNVRPGLIVRKWVQFTAKRAWSDGMQTPRALKFANSADLDRAPTIWKRKLFVVAAAVVKRTTRTKETAHFASQVATKIAFKMIPLPSRAVKSAILAATKTKRGKRIAHNASQDNLQTRKHPPTARCVQLDTSLRSRLNVQNVIGGDIKIKKSKRIARNGESVISVVEFFFYFMFVLCELVQP